MAKTNKKPAKPSAKPDAKQTVSVLVEMRMQPGGSTALGLHDAAGINAAGFKLDNEFEAIPMKPSRTGLTNLSAGAAEDIVIVRGSVQEDKIQELEAQPNVVKVWRDAPIAPFAAQDTVPGSPLPLMGTPAMSPCPIPPCDCTFGNPAISNIAGVATYLGVNQIWASGIKGTGIVIGIVDGGINAIGRVQKPGETAKVPRVIGGWPTASWGTTAKAWGNHGNMTSTDALGMAPEAKIYDIRISDAPTTAGTISSALAGFQWAIDRHKIDKTPHILSNSWGMFQKSWAPDYATDPNHPFTRKVVEAMDEGILVLFAAGNCGGVCPDGRCATAGNNGPGNSIWGANGHPRVMTVGAVNRNEQWVGYSSQGPAALDPKKPDFCSITHFAGYFPTLDPGSPSDGGTSAATPIAAGVVALLKQKKPALTQVQAKKALMDTAKNIGPAGWDQHSGAGIIRAKAAYDSLSIIKIKFIDDPKLKVIDDPKVKFSDDPKLKAVDDPKLKVIDDPKLKAVDDPKSKFSDDPKLKIIDDGGKSPISDIPIGPGHGPGQTFGGGGTPFILATPHHSAAWAQPAAGGAGAQQGGAGYEAILAHYQGTMAQLEQTITQAGSQIEALNAQYQSIAEAYQSMAEEYERTKSGEQEGL